MCITADYIYWKIYRNKRANQNVCKAKYNESTTPLFKYLQIPILADLFNTQLRYMLLKPFLIPTNHIYNHFEHPFS